MISTYATGRYNNGKINWNSVTNSRSVSIVGSFFLFAKHLFNPAFHFYFYRGNDHCHYTVDKEMASLAKLEIKSITVLMELGECFIQKLMD
mgnify:FL=1